MKFWFDAAMLGFESQQVIWMRIMKIARGDEAACSESQLMFTEKILAAMDAGGQAGLGATPASIIDGYLVKVRANAKRLAY